MFLLDEITPTYFIAVPTDILKNRNISPTAKLLYGVIDSFLHRSGVCYASNDRLAEEVAGCSERTISRCVSELVSAGYVAIVSAKPRKIILTVSVPDGQEGEQDGLSTRQNCLPTTPILSTHPDKNGDIVKQEWGQDRLLPGQNCLPTTPILSTHLDKNGDIVNKISKKEKKEAFDPLPDFVSWIHETFPQHSADNKNELYLAIKRFCDNRRELKKPYKSKSGVTSLCNRLRRISGDNIGVMIELLDRATDNGWQSIYPANEDKKPGKASGGRQYDTWTE